jgi:hypothetical protein
MFLCRRNKKDTLCVISGFRRELCTLMDYYATSGGNSLQTVTSSRALMGPIGCHETSVRNYHYWLHIKPIREQFSWICLVLNTQRILPSATSGHTGQNDVGRDIAVLRTVRDRHISTANTGRFTMFSVITNICNMKTKGPTLMELFTVTGKLKKFFFFYN